jgi:hypothetical protein
MILMIAPSGISEPALLVLRQAHDLASAIARRHAERHPDAAPEPAASGVLAVAAKLLSPHPEALVGVEERDGLLRLLALALDVARQEARDRHPSFDTGVSPDLELGDLRRRARNAFSNLLKEAS